MKKNTVTLRSEHHSDPPERIRHSGRAIIIKENKILLSHELNTNIYMSPGGGLEENETLSECCIREVEEETGLTAENTSDEFITVKEYCFETLYISHYFPCKITGTGKSALTATEIEHGITAEWVEIEKALKIFGKYEEMREDWRSLYLREFTVLNKFLQNNNHHK